MAAAEQNNVEEQSQSVTDKQPPPKKTRARQTDEGSQILPSMEYFVALVRKSKRPKLVLHLIEQVAGKPFPEIEKLTKAAATSLPAAKRTVFFRHIAQLGFREQQHIERVAERIVLLDDEYGAQAIRSLLDKNLVSDAAILAEPTDRYSRALYLFLLQDFPVLGTKGDQRFDHAERLQTMHRQWKSESYSSHYLGPKGIVPKMEICDEEELRNRIAALFPQISPHQILVEQFTRHDLAHADRHNDHDCSEAAAPVLLYTFTATFNGSTAHFKQVENGEVVEHEEPAAMSAGFSWEPDTGALSVFCEDKEVRRDLATAFRDVVLSCDGEINDMPMREFNLWGFSTPAILERFERERVEGVEKISIIQVRLARPFEQRTTDEARGREVTQRLASNVLITKDRRDNRPIYEVAYDDYGIDDLTGYTLSQVKLLFKMAQQPYRKAHGVTVQITAPNGFNDKSKSEDDRKRVLDQLKRLDVLREF